jgi:hypothetical protein
VSIATISLVISPLHPLILAALVDSFEEPRLLDPRPPRRMRSVRVRRGER